MTIKAELINVMGDDLTVVNAARVSFDKESVWESGCCGCGTAQGCCGEPAKVLSAADTKLINYLALHNHWTPFSHPQITLRETVPIFVARQRFKHMVGFTYNEVSRRYVDDTPEFYVPKVWRSKPDGSIKQGSGGIHPESLHYEGMYQIYLGMAQKLYEDMIEDGVAPEQARMVLPQSMLTSYYVTGSLAAFARAYKQRAESHSQVEIQGLAHQWTEIIAPLFPVSWAALTGD
ncbi:FAD-dependent thymidylate synthase [Pseudomonas luteola]|uniref:FAD-dependent thymidylate synthase n=1 Tax=Pseudomonas luteola TaxID=47886 RepID=UPI003A8A8E62